MQVDQRLMRIAAERQARGRAKREQIACHVYRRLGFPAADEAVWYVRLSTDAAPEDSTLEFVAYPGKE